MNQTTEGRAVPNGSYSVPTEEIPVMSEAVPVAQTGTFLDWCQKHQTAIAITAGVILAAAGAYIYWRLRGDAAISDVVDAVEIISDNVQ